jgi:hypothetical protein
MIYVSYALSLAAIGVMIVNTYLAFKLRREMIGGEVGDRWRLLTNLIILFLVGYVLSPLLLILNVPVEFMGAVVFAVFLFGAIFVLVVIRIIKDMLSFLGMLEE